MTTKDVGPGDRPFHVYISASGAARAYSAGWDDFTPGEFHKFPSGAVVIDIAARDADLAGWVACGWWVQWKSEGA